MANNIEEVYTETHNADVELAGDDTDEDDYRRGFFHHPDSTFAERLEQAGDEIKTKREFTSHIEVDEFIRQFSDVTRQCNDNPGNILHILVEVVKHNSLIPENLELLVKRLVEQAPDLVKVPNKDKKTPILMAIRWCQDSLLEYMITSCVEHDNRPNAINCLNDALSYAHDGKETALHAAFGEKLNGRSLKMLMEYATNETLSIGDNMNKTPMHLAVQFQKCNQQRVALIDLLIHKDRSEREKKPKSAKTFLDMCDKDDCSVFQEHKNTRRVWEQQMSRPKPVSRAIPDPASSPREEHKLPPRDLRLHARKRESKAETTTKVSGDRDGERSIRKGQPLTATEERELLRRKKKEEELRIKQKEEEEPARIKGDELSFKDYQPVVNVESARKDLSRNRSGTTVNIDGPMRIKIIETVRQAETPPNTAIKRSNTGHEKIGESGNGALVANQSAAATREQKIRKHINNSNKILERLQLYYMRTRNPEMVMFFLYGKNTNDIQTGFDYRGSPSPITWKNFKNIFGGGQSLGYKFDPVLQYATFPYVQVDNKLTPSEKEASHKTTQQSSFGRKDMTYFLDWLYGKGVRHIIKLSVEEPVDVGKGVHGDQTIQETLGKFIIEHLDWKKMDMDPETIMHIGSRTERSTSEESNDHDQVIESQIRKLTLVWSGSNAVLHAWSNKDALPKMRFLKEVEIIRPPPHMICDSKAWIDKKIKDFEVRLNGNRSSLFSEPPSSAHENNFEDPVSVSIRVTLIDLTTGTEHGGMTHGQPTSFHAPDKGINSHQWLKSVEDFAHVMEPFWDSTCHRFLEMNQNMGTAEQVERPVTIALIDDGVNKFQIKQTNQILEGKSFDFHDERVNPPYLSAKGHGTTMARMILRVCPMAKIYPIRLKTFNDPKGNFTIHADYAARAIQAALDKKVDIISMSWTLPMDKNLNADNPVYKVLQKAINANVLMFCSAPDKGKFTGADYPSAPFPNKFFRIGAANSDGTVFNWTPEDITFILPGVHVVEDQVIRKSSTPSQENGITEHTGSSVATALGAGLAAMILYCLKASILGIKIANRNSDAITAIPAERLKQIKQRDAMKGAFESLGTPTPNKFIQIWEGLGKVTEILRNWQRVESDPDASLKFMKEFIEEFGVKLSNSVK